MASVLLRRRRTVIAGLVVVAVVLSAFTAVGVPPTSRLWANLNWTILCLAAVAIAAAGTTAAPPGDRSARLFFTIGLAVYGLGQLMWDAELILNVAREPAPSDIAYLGAALPFAAGLVAAARPTEHARRLPLLLDVCVVSVSVVVVVLALFGRLAFDSATSDLHAVVLLSYPMLFLSVAGAGVVLAIASSAYPRASITLLAGLTATGVYWLIWLQQALNGLPGSEIPINHLFTLSLLLLGFGAATWETMPPRKAREADHVAVTLVPIAAFIVAIGSTYLGSTISLDAIGVARIAGVFGLVLIMARQTLLLRERERAQADVDVAQERLTSVLDHLPGVAWATDTSLAITFLRGGEVADLGLAEDSAESLPNLLSEADMARLREIHRHALAGHVGSLEVRTRGRTMVIHVRPVTGGGSIPVGVVGVALDVTAEREALERVAHAARMESLGRLAGGIAHDFNNLLTAINGYAEISLAQLHEADPIRADIEQIREAGGRASQLTRQILAFARQTPTLAEPIDVGVLIRGLEPLLNRLVSDDVDLAVELRDEPLLVNADRTQIEQLVVNLVVNAREAMPRGGRIEVRGSRITDDGGNWVTLVVGDTGIGMDEATRTRIFDPFFTTKEGGTGLGLATVYGAIRNAGGKVEVDSTPGLGSSFRVWLPSLQPMDGPAEVETSASIEPESCPRDARVLVVDDNEAIRRLAAGILAAVGYDVVQAAAPPAALKLARNGRAPDVLVSDVVMPVMSGLELAERLWAELPDLAVVLISGYAQGVLAGVPLPERVRLVDKPFTAAQLVVAVDEAWCERRAGRELSVNP